MALGNAHFIRLTGSMVVKQEFGLKSVDSFESYPLSNVLNHTPNIPDQIPKGHCLAVNASMVATQEFRF